MTNSIIKEQLDDIERVIKEQEDMANHIGNLEGMTNCLLQEVKE